jgi:hypothetical protein
LSGNRIAQVANVAVLHVAFAPRVPFPARDREAPMPDLTVSDLRPFIPARDFALSRKFYAGLGWDTRDVADGLALVQLADRQHFYIQDYYIREVAENCMLHLTVADAQAWYRHVSTVLKGNRFSDARVQPPKLQPYGAVVTFVHDPSGVLLHLCEWRPGAMTHG